MADGTIKIAVDLDTSQLETALAQIGQKSSTPLLQQQTQELKNGLKEISSAIQQDLGESLAGVMGAVQSTMSNITGIVQNQGMGAFAAAAGGILAGLVTTIAGYAPQLVAMAGQIIVDFAEGIRVNAESITTAIVDIVNNILTVGMNILPDLLNLGIALLINLADGLAQAAPGLIQTAASVLMQLLQDLMNAAPNMLTAGIGLIQAIGEGIQQGIGTILQLLPQLVQSWTEYLATAYPQVAEAFSKLMADIAPAIMEAIPVLLQALGQGIQSMVESLVGATPVFMQGVMSIVSAVAAALPESLSIIAASVGTIVTGIADFLANAVPQIVEAGMMLLTAIVGALPDVISQIVAALPDIIDGIVTALMQSIAKIAETGVQLLTALVDALPEIVSTIVDALPEIITGIIDSILGNLPAMIEAGINLFIALIEGLPEIITTIVGALPQITTGIKEGFLNAIPQIIQTGFQLLVSLIQRLPEVLTKICDSADQIVAGLQNAFLAHAGRVMEIGKNLLMGIWQGISSSAGWLIGKIKQWCGGVLDTIKGFFGIHSPSTVFRDQVGKMLTAGIVVGIEQTSEGVAEAMAQTVEETVARSEKAAEIGGRVGALLMDNTAAGIQKNSEGALEKFNGFYDKLETRRDFDLISEREYYEQLRVITDKYLAHGSKEWLEYTKKVYDYEQKMVEEHKDAVKSLYDEMADYAKERQDEVLDLQAGMEKKLKNYGSLYDTTEYNMFGQKVNIKLMKSFDSEIKTLENYEKNLGAVKDRISAQGFDGDVVRGFFAELADMDVDEAASFAALLNNSTDEEFASYISGWKYKQDLSKNISEVLYADEAASAVLDIQEKAVDETAAYVVEEMKKAGKEIPAGFFQSGLESAGKFKEAFGPALDSLMQEINAIISKINVDITPMRGMAAAQSMFSSSTSYNNNFVINARDGADSARQIADAQKRMYMATEGADI